MVDIVTLGGLAIVAFAGGAFGAAVGGYPAFSLAGVLIVAGEAATLAGRLTGAGSGESVSAGTAAITANLGLGPGLGPHVAFGGGVAAAAFAARRGAVDTDFPYHQAKDVTVALGTRPAVLVAGGAFGVVGLLLARGSAAFGLPWWPVAFGIVGSAFLHRIAFGYPLAGNIRADLFDMTPFERGERRGPLTGADGPDGVNSTDSADSDARYLVEPWLPHQYRWGNVSLLGFVVGVFGAFVVYTTGSVFLAFGLSAASLAFLALGLDRMPVTYHMALPASVAVLGLAGGADPGILPGGVTPGEFGNTVALPVAVLVGGVFGLLAGLTAELAQRIFYAHADTHFDPPAAGLLVTTFLIAVLDLAGVFAQQTVPVPGG